MVTNSGPKKIEKDFYLFREGDMPDAMYVVKSGKFAVVKTKQNAEIVLAEIGPGAMVGEMAFFDNEPRSASVKAIKDSEVIALPYKALHAQFQGFPEWCKAIMRTVNGHLRNANQRIKLLEKSEASENDLFPPHTITRLISILNLVGQRYGKPSPDDKGLLVNPNILRNYTIQIFHEPTHKMQKMMSALHDMGHMKVEDLGEGKQKIVILNVDLLFAFAEWYNDWLFKKEADQIKIREEEIKTLKAVIHFTKLTAKDKKGNSRVDLNLMQNESLTALGYAVKMEETAGLIQNKLMGEKIMEGDLLSCTVNIEEVEKITPFWEIIYLLEKIRR